MSEPSSTMQAVMEALRGRQYRYADERALHEALAARLTEAGIAHEREVRVAGGRIDFIVGSLGVEVKIKGASTALTRQLRGYADEPSLDELLVVTTRPGHASVPRSINGKPVWFLSIGGLSL